jgi:DNA polymerase III delta prime subunit
MEEFLWCEKYRPQTVKECILPDRLKSVFQSYVDKGEVPNMMLTGPAGSGKTTVAKAVCSEIGCDYLYINASTERGIDTLRFKITGYASTISLTGGRKVIILDEADGLTKEMQDGLKAAIEQFSSNCTFILTCNVKAKLIAPLHSRTVVIDFTLRAAEKPSMASKMFKRVEQILTTEGITYDKTALAKIVEKYFPDYRRLLGELQQFSALGSIDAGVLAQLDSIKKLADLVKHLKDKDFSSMRKWVVLNSDVDASTIFRNIYDGLSASLKPESIPIAVVTIAKYQYQSAFCADQEVGLVACLTELMVECDFK